ncbi:MAG: zf-HC2 domain-containing protein [Propionibacteriaceae bacterium]|jgi:anti-sigma factor (TIGR02949 family)|nr:zf-HC2 domain-containing protein [Propionibacteriaceae bacterium]
MGTDASALEDICPFVRERVNAFLDHELDEPTADLVRQHLAECEDCADEAATWDLIRSVLKRAYRPSPAPPSLIERVTAQIHAAEKAEAAASAASGSPGVSSAVDVPSASRS